MIFSLGIGKLLRKSLGNARDEVNSAKSGLDSHLDSLELQDRNQTEATLPVEPKNTIVHSSGNVYHQDNERYGTKDSPLHLDRKLEREIREAIDNKRDVDFTFVLEDGRTRTMRKIRGRKYLEDPEEGVVRRVDWHTGQIHHLRKVEKSNLPKEAFSETELFDGKRYHIRKTGRRDNLKQEIFDVMSEEDYERNYGIGKCRFQKVMGQKKPREYFDKKMNIDGVACRVRDTGKRDDGGLKIYDFMTETNFLKTYRKEILEI